MGANFKWIEFPDSIRSIGEYAFIDTHMLGVYLPDSLEVIEAGAFGATGIESVNVPKSVKYIGDNAFYSHSISGYLKEASINAEQLEYLEQDVFGFDVFPTYPGFDGPDIRIGLVGEKTKELLRARGYYYGR